MCSISLRAEENILREKEEHAFGKIPLSDASVACHTMSVVCGVGEESRVQKNIFPYKFVEITDMQGMSQPLAYV